MLILRGLVEIDDLSDCQCLRVQQHVIHLAVFSIVMPSCVDDAMLYEGHPPGLVVRLDCAAGRRNLDKSGPGANDAEPSASIPEFRHRITPVFG